MATLKRLYDTILSEHLATHQQMAFVVGPRQVGKTTTCQSCADHYCNWDNVDDRDHKKDNDNKAQVSSSGTTTTTLGVTAASAFERPVPLTPSEV